MALRATWTTTAAGIGLADRCGNDMPKVTPSDQVMLDYAARRVDAGPFIQGRIDLPPVPERMDRFEDACGVVTSFVGQRRTNFQTDALSAS